MANYEIPLNPEFTSQIRKFETTDPAHAALFNSAIEKLLTNDVFLRAASEQLVQNLQQHISDSQAAHDAYYQQSTGYTDQKIADLINGAPSTLDTLGEIATAMAENANVVDALNGAIGTKANQAEVDSMLNVLSQRFDGLSFVKCTQAQYDALDNSRPSNTIYIVVG